MHKVATLSYKEVKAIVRVLQLHFSGVGSTITSFPTIVLPGIAITPKQWFHIFECMKEIREDQGEVHIEIVHADNGGYHLYFKSHGELQHNLKIGCLIIDRSTVFMIDIGDIVVNDHFTYGTVEGIGQDSFKISWASRTGQVHTMDYSLSQLFNFTLHPISNEKAILNSTNTN